MLAQPDTVLSCYLIGCAIFHIKKNKKKNHFIIKPQLDIVPSSIKKGYAGTTRHCFIVPSNQLRHY
jgi:hypothetical protein